VGGENILVKKILVITDMDSVGSGYKHICVPLLTELMKIEDYEIKVIGFMYQGEEHNYPFSVIPGITIEEVNQMAINLIHLWTPAYSGKIVRELFSIPTAFPAGDRAGYQGSTKIHSDYAS
jgi:hypothetical protein